MQKVKIEKITLNIGVGKDSARLEKGMAVIKSITSIEPVKTVAKSRIPTWGLRLGLPIGCKLTLRKQPAKELLKKLLAAKDNKLKPGQFDDSGNVSFGIHEYIDIPGVSYDPSIGVMGLEVCVTLEKPGHRIKRRRIAAKRIPLKHRVKKEEAIAFMQENFGIKIGDVA